MWDSSFQNNDGGNGWAPGGEGTFLTDNKKDTRANALGERLPVPATISDLLENLDESDDKYKIGEYRFATVMTVGMVKDMSEDGGTINYTLTDPNDSEKEYTAVKYGTTGEDGVPSYGDSAIEAGSRVRVIGKLKGFNETQTIMVFNISEVSDNKDFTVFELEAKAARLFFEKNVLERLKSGDKSLRGMLAPPFRRGDSGSSQTSNTQSENRLYPKQEQKPEIKNGGSLQDKTLALLKSVQDSAGDEGSNISWISSELGNPDIRILRDVLAKMVEGGYVYQTANEDNFAAI